MAEADLTAALDPAALEGLDVAEGETAPATGPPSLDLSDSEKLQLRDTIERILDSHDTALAPRNRRLRSIEKAYNLVPDTNTQGHRPDASSLVSELTRSATNVATSQMNEAIIGTKDGLLMTQVTDDQDDSEETTAAVELAKAIDSFLEAYSKAEIGLEQKLYDTIHTFCKLGNARVRLMWEVERCKYWYRDEDNRLKPQVREDGKIAWDLIPIRNAISWPLSETDLQKASVVGHYTYMEHYEFRQLCDRLEVDSSVVKEILGEKDPEERDVEGGTDSDTDLAETLSERDIKVSGASTPGEIKVAELWCNMPLPGDIDDTRFYLFYVPSHKKILWVDANPLFYQRTPYFDFKYWRETESIHGTGVGHESLYPQAADSAMWNMFIDNLKVMGNFMRVFKAGSTAEAMRDEVGPGRDLVTEDPEGDVRFEQLGGDLTNINEGMDRNDFRHMRGTGINAPTQGFADPVLKSGASPGSYMQLIAQANKKFKQIDINFRNELGRSFMFMLELLQQFSPQGVFFQYVSDQTARTISQISFKPPTGDLSKRFRVMVKPPSAASNREMLRMNLMLIQNMTLQYVPFVIQLSEAVYGATDPAKAQRFKESLLIYLHEIYKEVLEVHEVPGLSAKVPKIKGTPQDEFIGQLMQQIGEMNAYMQQQQEAMGGQTPEAGSQLAQAGAGRGFPSPVPV